MTEKLVTFKHLTTYEINSIYPEATSEFSPRLSYGVNRSDESRQITFPPTEYKVFDFPCPAITFPQTEYRVFDFPCPGMEIVKLI